MFLCVYFFSNQDNQVNHFIPRTKNITNKTMQLLVLLTISMLVSSGVHALSCPTPCHRTVCPKVECPGDVVKDVCGCCDKCAKMLGERCGGPWNIDGECGGSLVCIKPRPVNPAFIQETGTCENKQSLGPFIGGPQIACCMPAISLCHNAKCSAFPDAVCKPNHCGGCKAEFFIGDRDVTAECEQRVALRGCLHNGMTYKQGENFKKDCNTCRCGTNGRAFCTKKGCAPDSEPKGCVHNGVTYKQGENFKKDCNTCRCLANGRAGCTKKRCAPDSEPRGCVHNGVTYKQGDDFKMDCNTCHCGANGRVACTEMACLPMISITAAPTRGCVHNDVTYKPGDNFKMDCNTCRCGPNGLAVCTKMACRPMIEPAADCLYKEGKYTVGQRFKDDCNSCTCRRNGRVACTKKACAKEQGCVHKSTKYASGSNFKDNCNTCTCSTDGKVSCTKMFCFPRMNLGSILNFLGFGRKSCSYNGRTYAAGQTFQGECGNTCTCPPSGKAFCTMRACADSVSNRLERVQRRRLGRNRTRTNKPQ